MAGYTANQVGDYFLRFCREHGDYLTNLKLQKIIYYSQAWHLALKDKPLFLDEIQAWVHGPVVPSLYGRFKQYRWGPITEETNPPEFSKAACEHLIEVFSVYGKFSAWDLERMTHQELPWQNARKGMAIDEEGRNPISHKDMKEFYSKLASKN